jgi:hypothetical protein
VVNGKRHRHAFLERVLCATAVECVEAFRGIGARW